MCPETWTYNHNTSMQHEAMHTLGFTHEQNRPDRDDFVEIHPSLTENSNYAKLTPENRVNTSSPYDFGSVMHYPSLPVGSDELTISVPGSNYKTPITVNRVYRIHFRKKTSNKLIMLTKEKNLIFVFVNYKK